MTHHPWLLASLALAVTVGCDRPVDTASHPCRPSCGGSEGDQILVQVRVDGLEDPVEIQLNPCVDRWRLPDGAAVVVALLGGFVATVTPVDRDERVTLNQLGVVTLYPSFPRAGIDFSSGALGDYRGTGARLATAAVLRYAVDGMEDEDGCRLSDRVTTPLSAQPPLLHGQSNGGNLALATLADEDLDLPPLSGVTTFEAPGGAQFVTVELGSTERPLPQYEPGHCTWEEELGLRCAMDYSTLCWDPMAMDDRNHSGAACFDLDGDLACDGEEERWIWGLRPTLDGQQRAVYSPDLTQALQARGLATPALMTGTYLADFWASRDGSLLVRGAVARQPDLPFLVLGTEQDHAQGIPDHPHITGLAAALQGAGAAWVRVNPDAVYVSSALGEDCAWDDNQANITVIPGDPAVRMLPDEAGEAQRRRAYTTAAFLELQDRRWLDRWEDDLDAPLRP